VNQQPNIRIKPLVTFSIIAIAVAVLVYVIGALWIVNSYGPGPGEDAPKGIGAAVVVAIVTLVSGICSVISEILTEGSPVKKYFTIGEKLTRLLALAVAAFAAIFVFGGLV